MRGQGGKELNERVSALLTVASWWAEKYPAAAYEWAMKLPRLPEIYGRDEALKIVAEAWVKKDPVSASEWAMKLPEGNVRDNALTNVAMNWTVKDPVSASEWAMKFPGEKFLPPLISQWAYNQPDNARNWIEQSSLSQDEKDKLLKNIPKKKSLGGIIGQ